MVMREASSITNEQKEQILGRIIKCHDD